MKATTVQERGGIMYQNILLEKEDSIAILSINRPEAMNALNKDTLLDINAALNEVNDDPNVIVLIITGAGDKSFVAGADIAYMKDFSAGEARAFSMLGQDVFRVIESMEKPVIAAINGFALGGGCEQIGRASCRERV